MTLTEFVPWRHCALGKGRSLRNLPLSSSGGPQLLLVIYLYGHYTHMCPAQGRRWFAPPPPLVSSAKTEAPRLELTEHIVTGITVFIESWILGEAGESNELRATLTPRMTRTRHSKGTSSN